MTDWTSGMRFVLSGDTGGRCRISRDGFPDRGKNGYVSFELECECCAVVTGDGSGKTRRPKLKRLRGIADVYHRLWRKAETGYFILPTDTDFSRSVSVGMKLFDTLQGARSYLAGKTGTWLIAAINAVATCPLPEETDPFTTDLPLADSFVAAHYDRVTGPFLGFKSHEYEIANWVLTYYPSGYYAVQILERCQLIDNGMRAQVQRQAYDRSPAAGSCFVYERTGDGEIRLAARFPTVAKAQQHFAQREGRWLLARWVDNVDTH